MSDQISHESFSVLTASPEDDLLFRLGSSLEATDFGAGRAARGDIIRRARHWLREEMPLMAQRICSDPRVEAFRAKKTGEGYELFVVICDIVGSMHGGLPIATIGALLTRVGVKAICGEVDSSHIG